MGKTRRNHQPAFKALDEADHRAEIRPILPVGLQRRGDWRSLAVTWPGGSGWSGWFFSEKGVYTSYTFKSCCRPGSRHCCFYTQSRFVLSLVLSP